MGHKALFRTLRGPDGELWALSFETDQPGFERAIDLGDIMPNIRDIYELDGAEPEVAIIAYGEVVDEEFDEEDLL